MKYCRSERTTCIIIMQRGIVMKRLTAILLVAIMLFALFPSLPMEVIANSEETEPVYTTDLDSNVVNMDNICFTGVRFMGLVVNYKYENEDGKTFIKLKNGKNQRKVP